MRLLTVVAVLVTSAPAWAATLHVPADYSTIQAGIDAAAVGDTVSVAPGIYSECSQSAGGELHCILLRSGVLVRGATGNPADVVLDASAGDRVARAWSVDDAALEGLTLTGASSFGGLLVQWSSIRISDCALTGNSGGAAYLGESETRFERCVVADNEQGGLSFFGAPIARDPGQRVVIDCSFFRNEGNAVLAAGLIDLEIVGCLFAHNFGGPSILADSAFPTLTRCTLVANDSGSDSGVVRLNFGGTIQSTVIAFNAGRAIFCTGQPVAISCTDLYENSEGNWASCIADQFGLNGNLFRDPLFCGLDDDNYTLGEDSPLLATNNDCQVLIGAFGQGCGPLSVDETSWGSLKASFR
ncbi:MAG: right-handed parallel beta-helix repeat-containing protein [bacterium]